MFHLGVQLAGEDVRVIEQVGHVCYENFRWVMISRFP